MRGQWLYQDIAQPDGSRHTLPITNQRSTAGLDQTTAALDPGL